MAHLLREAPSSSSNILHLPSQNSLENSFTNLSLNENFMNDEKEFSTHKIPFKGCPKLTDPYLIKQSKILFKHAKKSAQCLKLLNALKHEKDSGIIRHWNVSRVNATQFKENDTKADFNKEATNLNRKFNLDMLDVRIKYAENDYEKATIKVKSTYLDTISSFRRKFENSMFSIDNTNFENFLRSYVENQLSIFAIIVTSNSLKLEKEHEFTSPTDQKAAKFEKKMNKLLEPKSNRNRKTRPGFKKFNRNSRNFNHMKNSKNFNRNKNFNQHFRSKNANFNGWPNFRNSNLNRNFHGYMNRNFHGYKNNIKKFMRNASNERFNFRASNKRPGSRRQRVAPRPNRGLSYVRNFSKNPVPKEIQKIFKHGFKFIPTNTKQNFLPI